MRLSLSMSAVCLVVPLTIACGRGESKAPPPKAAPAKVQQPRTEADLSTVTLTPEAVTRLGVQTAEAAVERVSEVRTLGGEIVVPDGRLVAVTAPVAGTLTAVGDARPGMPVGRGQALFRLVPLAATDRNQRIEADRALTEAQAQEQAARQRLQRLEQLLKDGAASQRAVEEARADHSVATAALEAARERATQSSRNPIGPQGEITVNAPIAGVLQAVHAAQGQMVAASAPLFEVAQVDRLWIRVPVYAGDVAGIDSAQPVVVSSLRGGTARQARRVTAPPSADPSSASVNLFFELTADGTTFRPGERVTVQLPLRAAADGLVIPASAVVYDIHGQPWVYEDLGGHSYARRRVEVARLVGDRAIVSRGISAGTKVVTVATAELFGVEFGVGK
ncbi:MAG TPA: efflux RND transporter periplasmic adaptor subunit [Vicinamibacterales bacterium]|nr:efflux RND transporter periplasmic adaptor subunit [Vicinamibacterales bacterium]